MVKLLKRGARIVTAAGTPNGAGDHPHPGPTKLRAQLLSGGGHPHPQMSATVPLARGRCRRGWHLRPPEASPAALSPKRTIAADDTGATPEYYLRRFYPSPNKLHYVIAPPSSFALVRGNRNHIHPPSEIGGQLRSPCLATTPPARSLDLRIRVTLGSWRRCQNEQHPPMSWWAHSHAEVTISPAGVTFENPEPCVFLREAYRIQKIPAK